MQKFMEKIIDKNIKIKSFSFAFRGIIRDSEKEQLVFFMTSMRVLKYISHNIMMA